jgi:hypothetical protein
MQGREGKLKAEEGYLLCLKMVVMMMMRRRSRGKRMTMTAAITSPVCVIAMLFLLIT